MSHLLIILSLLLLTSPLFDQETGVLYQYKTSTGLVWKTFGNVKVQPKYEGEIKHMGNQMVKENTPTLTEESM